MTAVSYIWNTRTLTKPAIEAGKRMYIIFTVCWLTEECLSVPEPLSKAEVYIIYWKHIMNNTVGLLTTWWRHQMETFSALLAFCAGNSPVPVNSPHKGQWRGALMFSLICVWINELHVPDFKLDITLTTFEYRFATSMIDKIVRALFFLSEKAYN